MELSLFIFHTFNIIDPKTIFLLDKVIYMKVILQVGVILCGFWSCGVLLRVINGVLRLN